MHLRPALVIAVLTLLVPAAARATPTTVVIDDVVFFSSGAQTSAFPDGSLFRITFTYDPDAADLDGVANGAGAFPGTVSSITLELASLVFEYAGGVGSNLLTTDDLGIAPNLQDTFTILPGSLVSGEIDGLAPNGVQIESALFGAAPTMTVDDVLQPGFSYAFVSVTFTTTAGTTVIATEPGTSSVPEPSLTALLAGALAVGARRVRRTA